MIEFIQTYGQSILFGMFILVLLSLLLFIVIARPKATCCSASRIRHTDGLAPDGAREETGTVTQ